MRLNQYVAMRAEAQKQVLETLQEAKTIFGKPGLLSGMSRTYQPKSEEGEALPPELVVIQHRGDDVLKALADDLTRLWDVCATVDEANLAAKADVVVNINGKDVVLLPAVPTTQLLFLEHQLDDLDGLIRRLPTLDPAQVWELDPATGTWKTRPVQTVRTKKVPQVLLKHPPTREHPAQTEVYNDDIVIGAYTKVEESSAFPVPRVLEILNRVRILRERVKLAREEANSMSATKREVGKAIFDYLLAS